MIKSIGVKKLFGRFDYEIEMKSSGITIITGPNGFGKSTILRIINALSTSNFAYFFDLDFSELKIEFDVAQATIIKKEKGSLSIDDISLQFLKESHKDYLRYAQRRPWIQHTPRGYYDRRTEEFYTEDELFYHTIFDDEQYFDAFVGAKERKLINRIKEKLEQVKQHCGEVRLISDQRLIKRSTGRNEPQIIDVIRELPQRLKGEIDAVSKEYSRVANTLDSTYPKRLFAAKDGITSPEEYQTCLREANEKFVKLNTYNLVDMSLIDEMNYDPIHSTALKIYFDDFSEKYKVFQSLVSRLDLFTKIINSRLLFKKIKITSDNGFEVVDDTNPNKILQLSQLSSGEKQEIVLFYNLIFDIKDKLLLLIDEPEISLHISWQKKFLDDLMEVSKQTDLQVIVATHSPQVISNHLDLQIDLGELYGAQLDNK